MFLALGRPAPRRKYLTGHYSAILELYIYIYGYSMKLLHIITNVSHFSGAWSLLTERNADTSLVASSPWFPSRRMPLLSSDSPLLRPS